eukprot:6128211-Lingulodinium_polyedra.AAC.1
MCACLESGSHSATSQALRTFNVKLLSCKKASDSGSLVSTLWNVRALLHLMPRAASLRRRQMTCQP